ncbi:FOLD2 [Scenedesmus sp. PABB004]|nr:FOLD2 [Scenedesmus sp. PABB004]
MADHASGCGGGDAPAPAGAAAGAAAGTAAVRVALRARPLSARERLAGARACVAVDERGGGVVLGGARGWAFDHAFGPGAAQEAVFSACVADLVDAVVEGFNATVLAYGPTGARVWAAAARSGARAGWATAGWAGWPTVRRCGSSPHAAAAAGSGKTYTMGSSSALHCMPEQQGIIPRVITRLFEALGASAAQRGGSFAVRAQFLEIHNEELRDLLAPPCAAPAAGGTGGAGSAFSASAGGAGGAGGGGAQRGGIAIRECPDGQIVVTGAREEAAARCEDLAALLDRGALARATGATSLNEASSRSHAIFTIIVEQSLRGGGAGAAATAEQPQQQPQQQPDGGSGSGGGGVEVRCAKFHLVDLAGSERTKRTGVVGAALRETVTINQASERGGAAPAPSGAGTGAVVVAAPRPARRCAHAPSALPPPCRHAAPRAQGLLALGKVISALSDERRGGRHVPYRDSKLTRLLQDSLGGSAKTLMIACVSAADEALAESLTTLKYAARARRVRNTPVANRRRLGAGAGGVAGDAQALQLLLLRRFAAAVLGPLTFRVLPEQLLTDAARCSDADALRLLQGLQELAAGPALALDDGVLADVRRHDAAQQAQQAQLEALQQQVADLEVHLATAHAQAAVLELQLEEQGRRPEPPAAAAAPASPPRHRRLLDVQSHPLPALSVDASCDQGLAATIRAAAAAAAGGAGSDHEPQELRQQLEAARAQLAQTEAELALAKADLARDEEIFGERVREAAKLRDQLAAAEAAAAAERETGGARAAALHAELRRWRGRALALQTAAPGDGARAPGSPDKALAGELSLAALPSAHDAGAAAETPTPVPTERAGDEAGFDDEQPPGGDDGEDQEDGHLLAELQVVLADKAALEDEKAAAQAEAAAAARAFERSRAALEAQLATLAGAIASQEGLIATLQSSEAEARELGAVYLDRCRELETELAELSLDMEELQAALARVEADAAASAEAKAAMRAEYEARIAAVAAQMGGVRQQLRGQDAARLERERQRAAGRVSQLQTTLASMRAEQDALRRRLAERLAAQEKASADKARELAALRKAADAAKRRVSELEAENLRQRSALRARSEEAAAAQRQLRQLAVQGSLTRSRQALSPSPRHSAPSSPRRSSSSPSPPPWGGGGGRRAGGRGSQGGSLGVLGAGSLRGSTAALKPGQASSAQQQPDSEWVRRQVQLLAERRAATEAAARLRRRLDDAAAQHEHLVSAKAQLDIRRLRRRGGGDAAADGDDGDDGADAGGLGPMEQCLLEGLEDQLDGSAAEMALMRRQAEQQEAAAAAASAAAAQLGAQAPRLPPGQLAALLAAALDELASQGGAQHEAATKTGQLALELAEREQQLEEARAALGAVQHQHAAALADLAAEHERRVMALMAHSHQPRARLVAAGSSTPAGAGAGPPSGTKVAAAAAAVLARLGQALPAAQRGAAAVPRPGGPQLAELVACLAQGQTQQQHPQQRQQHPQQSQQQQQQQEEVGPRPPEPTAEQEAADEQSSPSSRLAAKLAAYRGHMRRSLNASQELPGGVLAAAQSPGRSSSGGRPWQRGAPVSASDGGVLAGSPKQHQCAAASLSDGGVVWSAESAQGSPSAAAGRRGGSESPGAGATRRLGARSSSSCGALNAAAAAANAAGGRGGSPSRLAAASSSLDAAPHEPGGGGRKAVLALRRSSADCGEHDQSPSAAAGALKAGSASPPRRARQPALAGGEAGRRAWLAAALPGGEDGGAARGYTQVKASVARGIRSSIGEQYPFLADSGVLDALMPKKDPMFVAKTSSYMQVAFINEVPLFYSDRDGHWFPTLRILHQYPDMMPKLRTDKGAIKFVLSGANIMCPGLTSPGATMHDEVDAGTPVAIYAEDKEHAMAVGLTTLSTAEMRDVNKGIGVELMHHLNDALAPEPPSASAAPAGHRTAAAAAPPTAAGREPAHAAPRHPAARKLTPTHSSSMQAAQQQARARAAAAPLRPSRRGAAAPRRAAPPAAAAAAAPGAARAGLIDGKRIAEDIRKEIAAEVAALAPAAGRAPGLAVVLVGARKDSETYVRSKKKACAEVGFESFGTDLPDDVSQEALLQVVAQYNADPKVDGILVQLPLPGHIDERAVLDAISLDKDVDGFHPTNIGSLAMRGRAPLFVSCTPKGCLELLKRSGVALAGKTAVVVGRSNIVGLPAALLLQNADATVTMVHSRTPNAEAVVRRADVVIAACGRAEMVRGSWIKPGAAVIDVGINAVDDASAKRGYRLVGDVAFDEAAAVASLITPVPGGVGPMTIAMLLQNTLEGYKRRVGGAS